MWDKILDRFLRHLITRGALTVIWPDGHRKTYGPGGDMLSTVRLKDDALVKALCLDPDLALGEGYMDERVVIEEGDLRDFILLVLRNRQGPDVPFLAKALLKTRFALLRVSQANRIGRAKDNVAHHYDLSDDLYDLFLDTDKQYSCAYWSDPGMTLEEAQLAKKRHIARKLRIESGQRVLDIGCGWGGMGLTLAKEFGAEVVGVTLSARQHAVACQRAEAAGLSGQVDFRLQDYRTLKGPFDRIVSVGMLEHVGAPNYGEYFAKVKDLLDEDGIALIHTIGRCAPPGAQSSWIAKYIFPGGYIPSLSQLAHATEAAQLWIADLEVWREHYATTLAEWRARFEARVDEVEAMYDARFVRMWRYYLVICECAFLSQPQAVFHLQLSRRMMAVPKTRDYLYAEKLLADQAASG
ncbi:class I SAM-dependent methyltransferase [Pseudaestuariivita sp.]|uniref:class I SAM-dependent methyltransferase n=1 Tax=Pseudaestuariivita sp. TaxID=2211669 RepID=UPI00405A2279